MTTVLDDEMRASLWVVLFWLAKWRQYTNHKFRCNTTSKNSKLRLMIHYHYKSSSWKLGIGLLEVSKVMCTSRTYRFFFATELMFGMCTATCIPHVSRQIILLVSIVIMQGVYGSTWKNAVNN